ncbi:HAD family hydrolase [Rhodobacter veldkampii DSM 11550]|uniref:TIGR01459 family HAD-type hydrolase n=1 Tax=Phaeovulum veldkampii DSM 11550 TaxID=1185920 RepID=A0A2T4JM41_9RHOB|nr:TIGR01459 family HAD-type hydrolase [Phaeovulum veldkampii]MBK5946796.1 HAD family hydrolase [Phaeovulum veldkampii DSM 11550]PTE18980.1 TIGR01459 family HAD-type hydrolase [Phaeovulum veldkampii DSM 11550]TDQ64721.1 HAD superfamily hydrolase (TIGR01459 family) [Phaeovulum veldkampii DSM 11550]
MTRIIGALSEISDRYQAVYCDIWGCLHNGVTPFPEAVAALQAFRGKGGKVLLLTNAPRPAGAVAATLDAMGVPRDAWDVIVTSGDAAQEAMLSGAVGRRVWHIGPDKDEGFFRDIPAEFAKAAPIERVPLDQAEGIVCTGPFDEMTEVPEDYRPQFLLAKTRGLPMLCANPDVVVDMGETRIYCAGALAALYEDMGGTALYFGKPHPPIYDLASRRLAALGGADPAQILAIGDGINTDVAGAVAEDLDMLFVTGGLAADQFGPDVDAPNPDLLRAWLATRQQDPIWSIGRLR